MKTNWIIVGTSGFPKGYAEINKIYQIAKGLVENNQTVTVLSRKGIHSKSDNIEINGFYENISYKYCSGYSYYDNNFILRNLKKTIGFLFEMKHLLSNRNSNLIINTRNNFNIIYYSVISMITNSKSYLTIVEDKLTHSNYKNNLSKKIDAFIYWEFVVKLPKYKLPISHYLNSKLNINNRVFILPPLCKYEQLQINNNSYQEIEYYLFCGSIEYNATIEFIIDSFKLLKSDKIKLYLILHGEQSKINKIKLTIDTNIVIYTNLSNDELFNLYKNAKALLIPLLNNITDIARFPQKIAEYCSVGKPIITTNVGEIQYYFSDNISALITKNVNIEDYKDKMQFILDNNDFCQNIGYTGYKLGREYFCRRIVMEKLIKHCK